MQAGTGAAWSMSLTEICLVKQFKTLSGNVWVCSTKYYKWPLLALIFLLLGLPWLPSYKFRFRSSVQKTVPRGREDTRVWCRETMFSQMVSYEFLLHEPLHGYFLYLVCAPPEKPTRRCEPEEGYLRCSKRFDHRSHSIIFLLFEFKSVDDVGAGKLREMLTLHTNPHAVHGRFTLKGDSERQVWNAGAASWILREN